MNAFLYIRRFALRAILLCAAVLAACALFLSSSPVAAGASGQAVALRAARNPAGTRAALKAAGLPTTPGRYVYDRTAPQYAASGGAVRHSNLRRRPEVALTSPVQIAEPTQTYDVFAPPPAFTPGDGALTPANAFPVWTSDQRYLVFSRLVTGTDGTSHYHLFSVSANGDAPGGTSTLHQITTGNGDEFFPALNPSNNAQLAFTSTAAGGTFQLYVVQGFSPQSTTVDPSTLSSLTIRTDLTGGNPIASVGRPTWNPSGLQLVFAAVDAAGPYTGISHIYSLYLSSRGGSPASAPSAGNPPSKVTDGPANDTDPAWSPDGQMIAFASTATATTGASPAVTQSPAVVRSLFLVVNGGSALRLTGGSGDDFSPAWNTSVSSITAGQLAFSRSVSAAAAHDVFYYQAYTVDANGIAQPVTEANAGGATQLNTDDAGSVYDDVYPAFSPSLTTPQIVYQSNRSITYNNIADGSPSETAVSLGRGATDAFGNAVGAGYEGLLVSRVNNVDPPTLLPYTPGEVVHVTDAAGVVRRNGDIAPGTRVTFTVRLSNREAGVDDNNVYLQIKDPDSRYQDINLTVHPDSTTGGLEHKVFTKDIKDFINAPDAYPSTTVAYFASGLQYLAFGNVSPTLATVSSATAYLFNAGRTASQRFTVNNAPYDVGLRGAVSGYDGSASLTLGQVPPIAQNPNGTNTPDPATQNPVSADVTNNNVTTSQHLTGGNPNNFTTFGQEYECQWINAQLGAPIAAALYDAGANATDYGTPYYLAGVDDQGAGSGATHAPRPEWLKLSRAAAQDTSGGVLYTASWRSPLSPSDFYIDVIAYDKAQAPPLSGNPNANFRIYDNVWGFSTQTFNGTNDILVVNDNALGQKFVGTTFGSAGLTNLLPSFYGTESYFTDIDLGRLPTAVNRYLTVTGKHPIGPTFDMNGNPIVDAMGNPVNAPEADDKHPYEEAYFLSTTLPSPYDPNRVYNPSQRIAHILNTLGVGSYAGDGVVDRDTLAVAGQVVPRSQLYSQWRILARGPLPADVLISYSPTFHPQPAVTDPLTGFTAPAADGATKPDGTTNPAPVISANRCVVWLSPYTGNLPLNVTGSLLDGQTQNLLRAYVNGGTIGSFTFPAGGRLFLSSPTAGGALTLRGAEPALNQPGSFLNDVLNAKWQSSQPGAQPLAGQNAAGNRISFDAYVNFVAPGLFGSVAQNFFTNLTTDGFKYQAPAANALLLSNSYVDQLGGTPQWRTEGSPDQLGPYNTSIGINGNILLGQDDVIAPQNGAHTDFTVGGQTGLIYNENVNGSRVVYSSFGLEGLGDEVKKVTLNTVDYYTPLNNRANIMHNIVCYLRTGTFTGTIFAANSGGQTIAGATVYLIPNSGVTLPNNPRQTYSAITDSQGNYRIDGLEPGAYQVVAYKTGYTRAISNPASQGSALPFTVSGDTVAPDRNLNLTPVPPGSITGTVTDSNGGAGIPNATVTFNDGAGTTFSAVTDANGNYVVSAAPAGVYSATASATGYATSAAQTGIIVNSDRSTTANFTLTAAPATITVTATDSATGLALPGVAVTIAPDPNSAGTVTTDANGNATFSNLPVTLAGTTYTLTGTLAGYRTATATQAVTPGQTAGVSLVLIPIPPVANGTLGGLVNDGLGAPLSGATVSVFASGAATALQTVTTAATTSPAAPTGDGNPLNYSFSLPPGTYDVTVAKQGFTSVTRTGLVVASAAFTRADFTGTSALQALHLFPAGYNFFSVPYDYTGQGLTFDTVFGVLNQGSFTATPPTVSPANANRSHAYVWQPQLLQYVLDPTPPADTLRIGQGYWIYLNSPAELTVAGTVPTGATVSVALGAGWNMIGVPSTSAIPVSGLAIARTGGTAITFADATSASYRILQPTLYTYTAGSPKGTAYTPVTASGSLSPYQAYWIYAYVNATLLIPTSPAAVASARQNATPVPSQAFRQNTVRVRGRTF